MLRIVRYIILIFAISFTIKLLFNIFYYESVIESFQYTPMYANMDPIAALQISTFGNIVASIIGWKMFFSKKWKEVSLEGIY